MTECLCVCGRLLHCPRAGEEEQVEGPGPKHGSRRTDSRPAVGGRDQVTLGRKVLDLKSALAGGGAGDQVTGRSRGGGCASFCEWQREVGTASRPARGGEFSFSSMAVHVQGHTAQPTGLGPVLPAPRAVWTLSRSPALGGRRHALRLPGGAGGRARAQFRFLHCARAARRS